MRIASPAARLVALVLGCGCAATGLLSEPELDTAGVATAPDDTAETGFGDETVPGVAYLDGPPPALCQVTVTCGREIPDEPKVDCAVSVATGEGRVDYEGTAGMEVRGRSSYWAPKPQYGMELRDANGQEVDARLLGLSDDSDWVLNGNYYDRSLFRTKLAFDLFLGMDEARYAPRSEFCELVVDGTYMGIYTLAERIKRNDERVPIEEDDGSGQSFVLKLHDSDFVYANTGGYGGWKVLYPKPEELGEEAQAGIVSALDAWYGAMMAEDPVAAGVFDHLDEATLLDIVLIEELAKNNDAWYLSLHAWKGEGGTIQFSPWDMDLTFGQPSYNDNENPESWVAYRPALPAYLLDSDPMRARVAERWAELRADALSDERVNALVERYLTTMEPALDDNFAAWPIEQVDFGGYLYPVSSYEEEEAHVRAWIAARLAWMDLSVGSY